MAGAEEYYSREGIVALLHTAMSQPNFVGMNTHLTDREIRALRSNPPQWPGHKPVFSPYATNKSTSYYVQVKPTVDAHDGKRHYVYVHRASCRLLHGPAPVGYECSHRLGSGQIPGIERDFNPFNLCWEAGPLNKSRGFCQMYYLAKTLRSFEQQTPSHL